MRPHPRIRKTIKYGGTALTVLLVVVWIASELWSFSWGRPPGRAISVANGELLWGKAFAFADTSGWGIEAAFFTPLWPPAVAILIPTAIAWWPDLRAYRRARRGQCAGCGYDRTGLATDTVCPECGSTPA